MNQIEKNEIPKYLKQKESNVSKAKKKSKHKHQYEECLIRYKYDFNFFDQIEKDELHTSLSSYCTICGKIGGYIKNAKYYMEIEQLEKERYKGKPYCRPISGEEIYERYHDKLPVFFVENYWKDDYVNLEQKYELHESYNGE